MKLILSLMALTNKALKQYDDQYFSCDFLSTENLIVNIDY